MTYDSGLRKSQIVTYTRDTLPPIMEVESQRLRELAELRDDQIDISDIPPITPEQPKTAVRGWENHPGRTRNRSEHGA